MKQIAEVETRRRTRTAAGRARADSLVIKAGRVTMSRRRYEALVDRIEDLEDTWLLNEAAASAKTRNYIPIEIVERLLSKEHPVRVWREHRRLTLAALSARSGVPISYISEIENRKKPGSVAAIKSLAAALGLMVDDLIG